MCYKAGALLLRAAGRRRCAGLPVSKLRSGSCSELQERRRSGCKKRNTNTECSKLFASCGSAYCWGTGEGAGVLQAADWASPCRFMRRRKAVISWEGALLGNRVKVLACCRPLSSRMSSLSSRNLASSGMLRVSRKPACRAAVGGPYRAGSRAAAQVLTYFIAAHSDRRVPGRLAVDEPSCALASGPGWDLAYHMPARVAGFRPRQLCMVPSRPNM